MKIVNPMNHSRLTGLAVLAIISLGMPTIALSQTGGTGIAPYVKIRWPNRVSLAPDGSLFYVHNPNGIRQLYMVKPGKTQRSAIQLTDFQDGIGGYNLSDDGNWIAITASVGGSEQADLFLYNRANSKMETLFSDPNAVYGSVVWRRDSKRFAYRANDESARDFHVYEFDLRTRKPKKLMAGNGYYYPVDYSKDGKHLIVGKYNSASHSQLFEVNIGNQQILEITPSGEKWSFSPVGYGPDDRVFFVNTNYRGDLKQIYTIDMTNGNLTPQLSDLAGREIDFGTLNQERTILAVGVNVDGYRDLHLRSTLDYSPLPTPAIDKGIVGNIDFAGHQLLFALNNANTPGIVYKWNMDRPNSLPVALTEADTQGIDLSQFRLPELIHYPSFDGTKIPAFMYLPPSYQKGQQIPFIVVYHGGPEGQYRPSFNRAAQYFLSQGYGLIAPNVRGSSGYGKAYIEADNYKKRMVSVNDGVWAARYVIDQGYTTEKKVAAWGGSYGGFMTMAVITEAPKLFGAACNVVGIVNFETFLKQTKAYRRHLREAEYGPLSDPEFLKSISPIYKVDRIETPLMLAHGLNDPRVPVGEAMQVAIALKRRGVEVEELYFPDEGHGFAKEANRLLYYEQVAKFFDKHLR